MDLQNAPLGADDAAKRDDVGAVFVDVRSLITQTYLHTDDIKSIRVVVGRKGSGKTHILRYIEESAKPHREVIFSALDADAIPFRLERQFARMTDRPHARGIWASFWRIVFCLSVLSRFTHLRANLTAKRAGARFLIEQGSRSDKIKIGEWATVREELLSYFSENYFPNNNSFNLARMRGDSHPSSLIHTILEKIHNLETLQDFISRVNVSNLETDVASLAKNYHQFHIIIDGIDDVSWRQPRTWLDFQVGLFDAIFFFFDAQRHSDQVVITAGIRNFVFQAAAESPHFDRIRNVLLLNWTPESAEKFLLKRLRQISNGQFADSAKLSSERPLATWLGFDVVSGIRRDREEKVESYFFRHTRLSPRNIIRLFNTLCRAKNTCYIDGKIFDAEQFCYEVNSSADHVCNLMLKTAAEEIIAFIDISAPVPEDFRAEGVTLWIASTLEDAIRAVKLEIIDWDVYQKFLGEILKQILPDDDEIPSNTRKWEKNLRTLEEILWRSNLIAFWDQRGRQPCWSFSWSPRYTDRPVPNCRIGFHSSLIGKCGLGVTSDGPVF